MIDNSASLSSFYEVYGNVLALFKASKPHASDIKNCLVNNFGWKAKFSDILRCSVIFTPWIPEKDYASLRAGIFEGFVRWTDFFLDPKDDSKLFEALQSESFQKKCGSFIISQNAPKEESPFKLHNLSPQRPLLHAKDPSIHTDRLVPTTSASTPQILSNESDFVFDVFDLEEDGFPSIEAGATSSSSSSSSSSENDYSRLYNLLLSSSVKFSEVFSALKAMDPPWTYVYSDPESHPHLEVNVDGSSCIYLRPSKKVSDRNMIFNEDYFYSENALVRYLKLTFGIETLQIDSKDDERRMQNRRPGRRSSRAFETDSITGSTSSAPPSAREIVKSKKSSKTSIGRPAAASLLPSEVEVLDAVQFLKSSMKRNLQVVKDYFRPLGWECISVKKSKLIRTGSLDYSEYLVAPWAKDGIIRESQNYCRIDKDRYFENIDFFDIMNEREALWKYLQANGFQRNLNTSKSTDRDRVEPAVVSKESVRKQHSKGKSKSSQDIEVTIDREGDEEMQQPDLNQSNSKCYDVGTDEYLLVQYLQESPPSFGKIKDVLTELGWRLVYEPTSKEQKRITQESYVCYFLAPSAKAKVGGYTENENKKNFVNINRDVLQENIDFFDDKDKEVLYTFLRNNGFAESMIKQPKDKKSSLPTIVSERIGSSDESVDKIVKKERTSCQPQPCLMTASKQEESYPDEYHLTQFLAEKPPSFAKIKQVLHNLGWKIVYETTSKDQKRVALDPHYTGYFLAPSADSQAGGYSQAGSKGAKNVIINRDILTENVDFFNLEDKEALYTFLKKSEFVLKMAKTSKGSSKSPRSIAASLSPETMSTSSPTLQEAISHLIDTYEEDSREYAVLRRLSNPKSSPSVIWMGLQALGWFYVREKESGCKYYVAPWSRDLDKTLPNSPDVEVSLNREKLTEGVDFFNSEEVPKLYQYLVENNFSRRRGSAPVLKSKPAKEDTKSASKSSKVLKKVKALAEEDSNRPTKKAPESQPVKHLGVKLSEGTPEYDIAVELSKGKPSCGIVWNNLVKLGWYLVYESYDDKFYVAPWVQDEVQNKEKTYKIIDRNRVKENVDFYRTSNISNLYYYLRKNDFSRRADSVDSSDTIIFSEEGSRLQSLGLRASTAAAKQPDQNERPSRFKKADSTKTSPCFSAQSNGSDDYVYDRESVDYFANSSSSEKGKSANISHESSPSQVSGDSEDNCISRDYDFDSDEYLAIHCLKENPVYYPKVWRFLGKLGWSTMYEKGREDCLYVAPWAWDLNDGIKRGANKYIVIDRSKALENMDYFLDRESMYDHIRKIGFRRTAQDEVYVFPEAERVHVKRKMTPQDSSDDRKQLGAGSSGRGSDVSSPVKEKTVGKIKKRPKLSAMEPVTEITPPIVVPKTWTLRENIELVCPSYLTAVTSSVGSVEAGGSHSSPLQESDRELPSTVIRRDAEKEELSSALKNALERAEVRYSKSTSWINFNCQSVSQGCSIYLCGNPGTGKTITATSVIQSLSSSSVHESHGTSSRTEDERRGFKVMKLVGTTFTSSAEVFREIARLLGKLRHGDSDELAKRTVVEHFKTQARRVHFDNCSHDSSPASRGSGGDDILSDGSKKKLEDKVLMTVLLLDEIDLCKKEAMKELFLLTSSTSSSEQPSDGDDDDERSSKSAKKNRDDDSSSRRSYIQNRAQHSSLILVGIGNLINWPESLQLPHYCIAKKLIFRVYNNEAMMAIVNHHTRNLLHASAAAMVIARVMNYRNGE